MEEVLRWFEEEGIIRIFELTDTRGTFIRALSGREDIIISSATFGSYLRVKVSQYFDDILNPTEEEIALMVMQEGLQGQDWSISIIKRLKEFEVYERRKPRG